MVIDKHDKVNMDTFSLSKSAKYIKVFAVEYHGRLFFLCVLSESYVI